MASEWKQDNVNEATRDWDQAVRKARAHGLELRCCSRWHYQLRHPRRGWLYNLYPSKHRIWSDPKHRGPFLPGLPTFWTMLDIVDAVIAADTDNEDKEQDEGPRCASCDVRLSRPGGYAGTGMCGPCATGDASTWDQLGETW